MSQATYRDYKIARWSPTEAVIRFYEGEYRSVVDDDGKARQQYVRTGKAQERVLAFDGDCTYSKLVALCNAALESVGSKDSIAEQVRRAEPVLTAITDRQM